MIRYVSFYVAKFPDDQIRGWSRFSWCISFVKHRFLYKFNIAKVWNQFLQRIKDFIFMCNQHYKVSNSLHFHFDARFLLNSLSKILYFKLKILNDVNMFLWPPTVWRNSNCVNVALIPFFSLLHQWFDEKYVH